VVFSLLVMKVCVYVLLWVVFISYFVTIFNDRFSAVKVIL